MSYIKQIVENPHPINKNYCNYWDFLLTSYEGGVDYCNAFLKSESSTASLKDTLFKIYVNGREQVQPVVSGNLFKHPKERNDDYTERMRMSYYYNFCAPIIDIYTNYIFKDAVNNDYESIESTVETISDDFDLVGSSIDEFRRKVAEMAQIYGHVFVVVDSPDIEAEFISSRQQQIENRIFPYGIIYNPQNVINWSLDAFGKPYWVMLREMVGLNEDFKSFDKNKIFKYQYKLWTRNEWYLYDDEYNLIKEGVHGLGVVPIVCIFDKQSKKWNNFLGVSSLSDIAFIARDVYNSCSELKQILRDQTFAFLAIQGTASEYDELSVGTSKAILYPENRQAPVYVSPPSANAEVYFSHIDRQIRKIYQLAKLEGGSATQEQTAMQQSGTSKAWDFNETNSTLSYKALNLQDGEQKIFNLVALWEGKEFDGTISYPNEFSITSLMDDLTEAEKSARLMLGETFDLEVKKCIHKKKFPRATEEELEQMEKEAKAKIDQQSQMNANPNGGLVNRFRNVFNANSGGNGGFQNG